MIQKETKRPRGRPRAYDPDTALAQARDAFWQAGYSATSLESLGDATGMNRPSLYGAFGDKRALYLATLERYRQQSVAGIEQALDYELSIAQGLRRFYEGALSIYLPEHGPPRGCFLIGTATTEAVEDPQIRAKLGAALREFETLLEARLRHARKQGELDAKADTAALASIASAVLHTLAIRSRAGDSRATLRRIVDAAIGLICGARSTGNRPRRKARRK